MSDDKIIKLSQIRKQKEAPAEPESNEFTEMMDYVVKPGDFAGFLRVVELLRTLGDTINIEVSPDDVNIYCCHHASEAHEGERSKRSWLTQEAAFYFHYDPELYPSFDDFITTHAAKIAEDAIKSLHYWDGPTFEADLPSDYESLKEFAKGLNEIVKQEEDKEE